jgi:UDP-3-O-[3-hydroxymyristoyl] glucosamine N-acyltransferase
MEFTVAQIAGILGGEIEGDANAVVNTLAKIEEGKEKSLTFLANPAYTEFIYTTKATAAIVSKTFVAEKPITATLIRVDKPYESFALLLETYNQIKHNKKGIEQPSFIAENATIGNDVYVGAFAYIGSNVILGNNVKIYPQVFIGDNTIIGDHSILFAGVKVYSDCVIGNHCTFHSGVVVGGDGFGFAPNSENNYKKVPQIGNVIIEDHVEIGANTTVDRATLGSTVIKKGAKIDNLIQIAHNVEIGENTVIAAQTGIAGSTKIGSDCMIGGQVGIVGHLTIAKGTKIAAQSGVGQSITKENEIVQGSPAFGIGDYKRSYVMFRKLPQMQAKIQELEKLLLNQNKA